MFFEIMLLSLRVQHLCCHAWYHHQVKMLHRWMWEQWSLSWLLCVYRCSLPLYRCISSTGRYRIVFHELFILLAGLCSMCIRCAKLAPCSRLAITSVSHLTTSGTETVSSFFFTGSCRYDMLSSPLNTLKCLPGRKCEISWVLLWSNCL